jgi:hypothetical protein
MSADEQRPARYTMKLPVLLQLDQGATEVMAETRDIGAHGLMLRMSPVPALGTHLSFTITLPEEVTLTENIIVRCKGRIIRVEESAAGEEPWIAASIDSYEGAVAEAKS